MTGAQYEWPVFCFSPEATIKQLFSRFLVAIFSSLRITESSQLKKVPMFEQAFKNTGYRECTGFSADYLLDQQLKRLEKDFLNDGGLRERMT
jgi:hypothetical protein